MNPESANLKSEIRNPKLVILAQTGLAVLLAVPIAAAAAETIPAPGTKLPPAANEKVITAADVTVERVGTNIPGSAIGEAVGGVTLSPPHWIEAATNSVAHAVVDGSIASKDPKGNPIKFRVLLPARWSRRAIQVGGAGINGFVPMLRGERAGSPTAGFARYGSDSGHQMGQGDDWALNEEAIRNLGYLQMKKTHDAAMVINNYMAARALFDMSQGDPRRNPWAALRAPDGVDPSPTDTSANARLTDGQIETLKFVYSRYKFATPLAHGVRSFGMWVPNTDPAGSGLIADRRFRGQEGADDTAPRHSHLGGLGVTGFLMQNLSANPLDYVEGGPLNKRREQLSEWLDSTNPDLAAFYRRGGKMMTRLPARRWSSPRVVAACRCVRIPIILDTRAKRRKPLNRTRAPLLEFNKMTHQATTTQ